MPIQQHEAFV